jgi:hypothetical protein
MFSSVLNIFPKLFIYLISFDRNFKLKGKVHKLQDIDLLNGTGVFVDEPKYQEHINNYKDQPEVCLLPLLIGSIY